MQVIERDDVSGQFFKRRAISQTRFKPHLQLDDLT